VPPLGNLFDSVYPQTEVCHRSQLDAAMGSDSDRVDEVRSTAAIVGKALTGAIMARTRLEVSPVPTPRREPDKVLSIVASMPLLYGGEVQAASSYVCPMHPEVTSNSPGTSPKCGMKLVPSDALPASALDQQEDHTHGEHEPSGHGGHHHGDHGNGLEWGAQMPEINRATNPTNMIWKLLDRQSGAENHAISWAFTVGDRVKIRLINEMDSDHPMHLPFHIHGAGHFLILSRDEKPEPILVWKPCAGSLRSPRPFLPLFARLRGRGFLRSSDAQS
jgi:Heavy metal binding domain